MSLQSIRRFVLAAILAPALTAWAGTYTWGSNTYSYGAQVNISGATLFQGFFGAPASTNDFIDANGNGVAGFSLTPPYVDQLSTGFPGNTSGSNNYWLVQYRGVGSGSGLAELDSFYNTAPTTLSIPDYSSIARSMVWTGGASGTAGAAYSGANSALGGTPVAPNNIDIAIMDVPTRWLVQSGSQADAAWNKAPTSSGYGKNPIGITTGGATNKVKSLTNLNINAVPDSKTIVDTSVAWVPTAIIANRGTGLQNITQTDLQHLYVTGRLPNGENLVAATRDPGSGTKNATMNSLGIDPSWGMGDNLNAVSDTVLNDPLGPNHAVTNMKGTDRMENSVMNTRLAVGYAGLNGVNRAVSDVLGGQYEVLSVKMDAKGGTSYVRPTINSVLDNGNVNTGWQIGGNETMATVGDPEATSGVQMMANQDAAKYVRNITHSIAAFVGAPAAEANYNMPGEYLATTYFLTAGISSVPDLTNPTNFIANPNLNPALREYIRANNGMGLGVGVDTPDYGSVNVAGLVPARSAGPTYNDGSATGSYTDSAGHTLVAGQALSQRNALAGDFHYDGQRNVTDVADMMVAAHKWQDFEKNNNNGGAGYACVHIIGDFNGDGNFDSQDVRYFADGLAKAVTGPHAGNIDRKAGFMAVDNGWTYGDVTGRPAGNYFNTTIKTGKAYVAGDSRGDIAGNTISRGAGPAGADGTIDAKDIDYVQLVVHGGLVPAGVTPSAGFMADGSLHWSNLNEAVFCDLSADITGDLVVGKADVDELVNGILHTNYGDANLDGKVSFSDYLTLEQNFGKTGKGWAEGDFTGDGNVKFADYLLLEQNFGKSAPVPEPATLSLLVLGGIGALLRRRAA